MFVYVFESLLVTAILADVFWTFKAKQENTVPLIPLN
jgi:hypothetical protein